MFASSNSFSTKAASLPQMASLLWYHTEDLNLLGQFDRNVGFDIKMCHGESFGECHKM